MVQPRNGIEDLDMSDRSTIQSIALDRLIAHPDNPNRMSSSNFAKLIRNIEQTGRYEPLIVRPYREKPRRSRRGKAAPHHCERTKPLALSEVEGEAISSDSRGRGCHVPRGLAMTTRIEHLGAERKPLGGSIENRGRFQIINGYHRWQALRQLGYKRADVIVWDVDDDQADVLLATLNRLGGSDELSKKISLLKKLSKKMNARELSKLIPQTPGQIKRLVNLRIPKSPAKIAPDKFANPLVFFVTDEQKTIIEHALSLARGLCHSFARLRPPGAPTKPPGPLAGGPGGLVGTPSERSAKRTVIPTEVSETNEAEESVQTDRHPSSFQPVVEPLRGEVRIDPSAALGVTSIEHRESNVKYRESSIEHRASGVEHQASSLTLAEAKAETLTLIAQHFIDTNVQGYDENEDQVCPA
jgi:hypothetical protein